MMARLIHGDCLARMGDLPDASIDLILTDPPYHRVKADAWDRQWGTDADYLEWIGRLCGEWRRVLKPNGSLYCFASPRMAARVECKIGESFEVLNRITWRKDAGWAKRQCKEEQRAYFPASEAIIFAEQFGADSIAMGEAGYAAKCEELRQSCLAPLRDWFLGEKVACGLKSEEINQMMGFAAGGSGAAGRAFRLVQWGIPTETVFRKFVSVTGKFRRDYAEIVAEYDRLMAKYEDLRRKYDDLRRPFAVSADVPYTDVWDFPTVPARSGKHPCEKPLAMMEHIVAASSRPGATVLDCFMGSGVVGKACRNLGRDFIGIEADARWFARCACELAPEPDRFTLAV